MLLVSGALSLAMEGCGKATSETTLPYAGDEGGGEIGGAQGGEEPDPAAEPLPPAPAESGFIVYVKGKREVWACAPDGSSPKKLFSTGGIDSPMGGTIRTPLTRAANAPVVLFATDDNDDQLIVCDVGVGKSKVLVSDLGDYAGSDIALSPDGREAYFIGYDKGDAFNPGVYCIKADGSGRRRLAAERLDVLSGFTLSPDGSRVAYRAASSRGVIVVDTGSGQAKSSPLQAYPMVFSEDGTMLFAQDGPGSNELSSVNVATDGTLSNQQSAGSVRGVFQGVVPGHPVCLFADGAGTCSLYRFGSGGMSSERSFSAGGSFAGGSSVSPDLQFVVYASGSQGNEDIYTTAAGQITRELYGEANPVWVGQ